MTTETQTPTRTPRTPFESAKRLLLLACAAIAGGLAIAGSVDRSTGGVIVLIGWLLGVGSLHRLGRTGSDRGRQSPP
jgi:hypothetical protein